MGVVAHINRNHWDSCRRRVYRQTHHAGDPKLARWLREHPTDTAKVGPSLPGPNLTSGGSSSSTSRAPAAGSARLQDGVPVQHAHEAPVEIPPPPGAPGDLLVFEGYDEGDCKSAVNLLVSHGVQPIDAQRHVCNLMKGRSTGEPVGFFELYGQGGLKRAADQNPSLNVAGLEVLDLRTLRPDGRPWDFTKPKDRAWALRLLREQKPRWVVAAPPCTAFSVLNVNLNYGRMPAEEVKRKVEEGLVHLRFVAKVYAHHIRHGNYVLHEHPRGSHSWKTAPIQQLLRRPDVHVIRADQCQFGAVNTVGGHWADGRGDMAPIIKPTRFMSKSVPMLKRLHRVCNGGHVHQPMLGGRAASSACYPLPLLQAILQGMSDTEHEKDAVSDMTKAEYEDSLLMSANVHGEKPSPVAKCESKIVALQGAPSAVRDGSFSSGKLEPGQIPTQDGATVSIKYDLHDFKPMYLDEYTREALPHDLACTAIKEELD